VNSVQSVGGENGDLRGVGYGVDSGGVIASREGWELSASRALTKNEFNDATSGWNFPS
jgi:hypothetical protein